MGEQIPLHSKEENYIEVKINPLVEAELLVFLLRFPAHDLIMFNHPGISTLSCRNRMSTIDCQIDTSQNAQMPGEQKERLQAIQEGDRYRWIYFFAGFPEIDIQRDDLFLTERANQILELTLDELAV